MSGVTNEKPPLKEDLMREIRARSISIGLLAGTVITAVLIGFLTGWKY